MKIKLITMFFIMSCYSVIGQWTILRDRYNTLFNVTFVNDTTGLAVGMDGLVLKTTDRGRTWQKKPGGITEFLYAAQWINADTCFAAGNNGRVIRSYDGGDTWSTLTTNVTNSLRAMFFINKDTGWVCGQNGRIIETNDGGNTWKNLSTGTTAMFNSIFFTDSAGYAVGSGGTIIKTVDYGNTWTMQTSQTTNNLTCIYFHNNNTGIAVGYDGTVVSTNDGGQNWTAVTIGPYLLFKIFFSDSLHAFAGASEGMILRSSDAGVSWSVTQVNTANDIQALHCFDSVSGIGVGNNGLVIVSDSIPAGWEIVMKADYLEQIQFVNRDTGFVAGSDGTILRTTDGGNTWNYTQTKTTGWFNCISFVDSDTGYAGGNGGFLRKTTDGGLSWDTLISNSFDHIYAIHFIDSVTGYCCGYFGLIMKTVNGGRTWVKQNSGTERALTGIHFFHPDTGVICGWSGTILRTTDGGLNWSAVTSPVSNYLMHINFPSDSVGYIFGWGGVVLRSYNKGLSWVRMAIPVSTNIWEGMFWNSYSGYAVGNSGLILNSDDGATYWEQESSLTARDLKSIYITPDRRVFACGANGIILRDTMLCEGSLRITDSGITNPSCNGRSDGAITNTITGNPTGYVWTNGATTLNNSGLEANTWSVTVQDAENCKWKSIFVLTQPSVLTITNNIVSHVRCNGNSDGSIQLTSGGGVSPYSFTWNDGNTMEDRTNFAAGTYIVTLSDAHDCDFIRSINVTQPSVLTISSLLYTHVSSPGGTDGQIDISISGGTPAYVYFWSNSAVTQDISGLSTGTYSVTVTDQHLCTDTGTIFIDELVGLKNNFSFSPCFTVKYLSSEQLLEIQTNDVPAMFRIADISGRIVFEGLITGSVAVIPVYSFMPGIYFIFTECHQEQVLRKVAIGKGF